MAVAHFCHICWQHGPKNEPFGGPPKVVDFYSEGLQGARFRSLLDWPNGSEFGPIYPKVQPQDMKNKEKITAGNDHKLLQIGGPSSKL